MIVIGRIAGRRGRDDGSRGRATRFVDAMDDVAARRDP